MKEENYNKIKYQSNQGVGIVGMGEESSQNKAEENYHHRDVDTGKKCKAPLHETLPCQRFHGQSDYNE
jgi:hypothetical protein